MTDTNNRIELTPITRREGAREGRGREEKVRYVCAICVCGVRCVTEVKEKQRTSSNGVEFLFLVLEATDDHRQSRQQQHITEQTA